MNYEALIERDLDAIPAAARVFLEDHSVDELWMSVTRFAVLAYAPSQHAKRAVMACRATHDLRDELGGEFVTMIIACARYAAQSRQPWSEPPILDPPPPSSGEIAELREAMRAGDRLRAERWLSARLTDAEDVLKEIASGDALLMLETAGALLPHLGERGRYALLRMPVCELVSSEGRVSDVPLPEALSRAVEEKGAPDAVQAVLAGAARRAVHASMTHYGGAKLTPYALGRDYAQTLLAHLYARRLQPADAVLLLDAVHHNLESGENYAEWSFA